MDFMTRTEKIDLMQLCSFIIKYIKKPQGRFSWLKKPREPSLWHGTCPTRPILGKFLILRIYNIPLIVVWYFNEEHTLKE